MINPCLDTVTMMSTKARVAVHKAAQLITSDNVTLRIEYYVAYEIVHPYSVIMGLAQLDSALITIASGRMRGIVSTLRFQDLLKSSREINETFKSMLEGELKNAGVRVTGAEVTSIVLSNELTLSMAQVAISERDREAQVKLAEANLEASKITNEAAAILKENKNSMDLHFFETVKQIAQKWNETVITADGMLYMPQA